VTPENVTRSEHPDHEALTKALEHWLEARLAGTGPVQLGPLDKPGSGLSAGTLLFDAHRDLGPAVHTYELVVRIPPMSEHALFPSSDLTSELATRDLLAAAGVPVAPVVGLETDPDVLGRPFLVTHRVRGRLVDSSEPYLSRGWLHDSTPELQLTLARGFFRVLAEIHSVQLEEITNAGLLVEAKTGIGGALARWTSYLDWAGEDTAPDALNEALRWCTDNRPTEEPAPTLLWGDAQLANAVFADDGSTAAILDFELASAGPAELDLGWFFCLHDMTVARCGQDLAGFADRPALISTYEERMGRQITDLGWYEVFAAVCTASILVRMASLLSTDGVDALWLARSNPALDYIAARLR
jgi:aminoglycoside phosphotransferase (APT) family kinase protein